MSVARNKLAASGSFYFNARRDNLTLVKKPESDILEGEIVVMMKTNENKRMRTRTDTRPHLMSIRTTEAAAAETAAADAAAAAPAAAAAAAARTKEDHANTRRQPDMPRYIGVSQTGQSATDPRTEQGFVVCTHGHVTMHVGCDRKLRAGTMISFGEEKTRERGVNPQKKRYGIKRVEDSVNPVIGFVLCNQNNRYSTVDVLLHPSRQCWIQNKIPGAAVAVGAVGAEADQQWRTWEDRQ